MAVGKIGTKVESLHGCCQHRRSDVPRRVAVLSMHTSPLEQPGTGDAGGMNVYIAEVTKRLAASGVEIEIFTRATRRDLPPVVEMAPGVLVRNITCGPFGGLTKEDLPAQLCAFTAGVLRVEAAKRPGWYDLIHSHYWLSGQVGWVASDRWGAPLVHTAHTLAKVKNRALADGDTPEPRNRVLGEEQVVNEADRLVANTPIEARDLVEGYAASPDRISVVSPGVDLEAFAPDAELRLPEAWPAFGTRLAGLAGRLDEARRRARRRLGLPPGGTIVAFAGRIQPLKAPDVLIRAAAALRERDGDTAEGLTVLICGGPSGSGKRRPEAMIELVRKLGIESMVRFMPAQPRHDLAQVFRAADLVAVPSHNESFGLVALEAQSCGTPVVAASVGGLVSAVRNGVSGLLVDGHRPADWAVALGGLLRDPTRRAQMAVGARAHARQYSWNHTACGLIAAYRETIAEQRRRKARLLMA